MFDGGLVAVTDLNPSAEFEASVTPPPDASAKRPKHLSDGEVARLLIEESINDYPGNCPRPNNTDSAGHMCGGRSAAPPRQDE